MQNPVKVILIYNHELESVVPYLTQSQKDIAKHLYNSGKFFPAYSNRILF